MNATYPPLGVVLPVLVYQFNPDNEGLQLQEPQCGHFTSTGDLIVSDETPGSGIWEFQNMAGSATPTSIAPTRVLGSNQLTCGESLFVGAGLTQLKNGDLALVDNQNGCLFIAPYSPAYPHFSTARLITLPEGVRLINPVGVARDSVSDIFISSSGSEDNPFILQLDSNYISGTSDFANGTEFTSNTSSTCISNNSANTYEFMQFSADDTLYVAVFNGTVLSIPVTRSIPGNPANPPSSCGASTVVGTLPAPEDAQSTAIGIALPPTTSGPGSLSSTVSPAGAYTCTFDFGFSAFQILPPTPEPCTGLVVMETQTLASSIASLTNPSPPVGSPFLGENGLITVFNVTCGEGCQSGGTADFLIGAFTSLTNPRIVQCEPGDAVTCTTDGSVGVFPTASIIPGDPVHGSYGGAYSEFYQTEVALLQPGAGGGFVCGPFFVRDLFLPDPSVVVDGDDLLTISFRLTNKPATPPFCSGPGIQGISNAKVEATLAQFPPFRLILLPNPRSPGTPPLFTSLAPLLPGWYTYILNVKQAGLGVGTYDFSAIFNTNNAPPIPATITVVPGR